RRCEGVFRFNPSHSESLHPLRDGGKGNGEGRTRNPADRPHCEDADAPRAMHFFGFGDLWRPNRPHNPESDAAEICPTLIVFDAHTRRTQNGPSPDPRIRRGHRLDLCVAGGSREKEGGFSNPPAAGERRTGMSALRYGGSV